VLNTFGCFWLACSLIIRNDSWKEKLQQIPMLSADFVSLRLPGHVPDIIMCFWSTQATLWK
jgi:hypothetical protein